MQRAKVVALKGGVFIVPDRALEWLRSQNIGYTVIESLNQDDVVQALMLPVLALIPMMTTGDERRSRKRRALVLSCVAAAVVLISAAAAAWKLDAVRWVR